MKLSSTRTHLKNARGLGAAHDGTHHFWIQRVTAVALIPLTLWFVTKLAMALVGEEREAVASWLSGSVSALMMALFVVALFTHARMGIQTIIEDYVHTPARKLPLLVFSGGIHLTLCGACLFAIARLHFVGI